MAHTLRDVARAFSLGEATLEMLRTAARAERMDRRMGEQMLALIADWERGPWAGRDRGRSELRARVKRLIPPDPPPSSGRRDPSESIYAAGLRGQRRRP